MVGIHAWYNYSNWDNLEYFDSQPRRILIWEMLATQKDHVSIHTVGIIIVDIKYLPNYKSKCILYAGTKRTKHGRQFSKPTSTYRLQSLCKGGQPLRLAKTTRQYRWESLVPLLGSNHHIDVSIDVDLTPKFKRDQGAPIFTLTKASKYNWFIGEVFGNLDFRSVVLGVIIHKVVESRRDGGDLCVALVVIFNVKASLHKFRLPVLNVLLGWSHEVVRCLFVRPSTLCFS